MTENLEAKLIGEIGDARHALDVATAAVGTNEQALADIRLEIAALDKLVPRVSRIDLVKQMSADTMRRRAGL